MNTKTLKFILMVAAMPIMAFGARDTAIYNGKLTSELNANGFSITNVPSPIMDGDVANKAYVDANSGSEESIRRVSGEVATNVVDKTVADWARKPNPAPVTDLTPAYRYTDAATNAIRHVDGAARPLPKYLHALDFADSYPDEAAAYYRFREAEETIGGCSAVRDGGFLYRNFDFPFDDRAEFVVKMSAGPNRFASVGVAQVGTNLTEQMVTSGKWSKWYKALPGATVDGINENGVVAEINVVDTPVTGWHTTGDLHPLAAVRWVLDNATNAQHGADYIAANIRFPSGWTQNFHYMIADAEKTYIVENGTVTDGDEYHEPDEPVTMTNFQLSKFPWDGMGMERFGLLLGGANITNAWFTRAYRRETNPPWVSDLADVLAYTNAIFDAWASHPKEYFRGKTTNGQPWWQTVHTSIYDITNRTLRIAVQEQDDWYTFALPKTGTDDEEVRRIAQEEIATNAATTNLTERMNGKLDKITGNPSADFGNHMVLSTRVDGLNGTIYQTEYGETFPISTFNFEYGIIISSYYSNRETAGIMAIGGDYLGFGIAHSKSDFYDYRFSTFYGDGFITYGDDYYIELPTKTGTFALTSDITPPPGNYAAVSNAAMNAVQMVDDAAQNLRYTITADDGHFYFSPVSAIDPTED